MQKTKMLEESPGNASVIRVIYFIGMIWLMGLTTYIVVYGKAGVTEAGIFFGVVAGVFTGGKVIQKYTEVKKQPSSSEQ